MRNNATRFRFWCDTFGTAKRDNQAASLFLHNLSSILYTSDRWSRLGRWGEYLSGSRLALAQSCSRRHHVESASGCGSYRLIARGDCAETPICFLRRKGMVACTCSRVRLIGAWRPLELVGGVTTAVCGFSKLAENFFKKVLDRNRRSVNIVDAPFTGN